MERSFSSTLSRLRRERGISQRTAAKDLHISQALLSHYENGAREPGLGFVCRACDYYGVTADYVLGRTERRDNSAQELESNIDRAIAELETLKEALCGNSSGNNGDE